MFTRSMPCAPARVRMLPNAAALRLPRNAVGLCLSLALSACEAPPPPGPAATRQAEPSPAPSAVPASAGPAAADPAPIEPPEPSAARPEPEATAASTRVRLAPESATLTAPERFTVILETTRGDLHVDVRRSWAPLGADRFYNLVKLGFYDDNAFFRVVDGFVAQTGLHGDPAVNRRWRTQRIADDPVAQSNLRGMVSFATSGKNARTTQFFINLGNNQRLDGMGFAPFGRVRELGRLAELYAGYGEGRPAGIGPDQGRIQREGNAYLQAEFPRLDYIRRAIVADVTRVPGTR